MTPDDNSLETGYEASSYNSSLEGQHQTGIKLPSQSTRLNVSLFRFNKVAVLLSVFAVVLFLVVAGIALGYDKLHQSNKIRLTVRRLAVITKSVVTYQYKMLVKLNFYSLDRLIS